MSVQSVLAKINLCRTRALGGRWFQCDDCGETTKLFNSCGDRHCPGCSGAKRADFNEKASQLITPGADHFQVVFTVPEIISTLALANRHEIADLLFGSAWKALSKTIETEQGYEPAAMMVLHTWNQQLAAHWHVHALVPGVGPALEGDGVKQATSPWGNPERAYLVDAINLRSAYRKAFLRGLRSLYRRGKLSFGGSTEHLQNEVEWNRLLEGLEQQEWVSHIEPPPANDRSEASDVVGYMTRYLTGGPISDHRIVSASFNEVTFLAREGNATGGSREQVPLSLSGEELMIRWWLQIQPPQLTKTRCFGGWSNSRLKVYQRKMKDACEVSAQRDSEATAAAPETGTPSEPPQRCCEHCGSERLRLVGQQPKPSWSEVLGLDSQHSPWWYAESQELEEERAWAAIMGEGFYEFYVENVLRPVESARETAGSIADLQTQPLLPGLEAEPVPFGSNWYNDSF